jgi:hypothetical protein
VSADLLSAPAPRNPRNRGWLWFFIAVGLLTVVAVGIIVTYGQYQLRQQITREQLEDARKLWEQHGPRDYRLRYKITMGDDARTDTIEAVIREGKVVSDSVTLNGQPLKLRPDQHLYHDMPALFDFIDGFLKHDAKPDMPRTFARADFDPHDGHLKQYRRKVLSGRERQEILVEELTPLKSP